MIFKLLYALHGDQVPCLRTVERWCKRFREGHDDLEDEARPGTPVTETTFENIEQVRLIIDDDPRVSIEEIQEQTGLSYGTTQRIIVDHLQLTKVTARYLSKQLADFQRRERVRICKENLARFSDGTWRLCNVVTGTSRDSITSKRAASHHMLLGWQKVILHPQSFVATDLLRKRYSSPFSNPSVRF
jgi:hypothetical protein